MQFGHEQYITEKTKLNTCQRFEDSFTWIQRQYQQQVGGVAFRPTIDILISFPAQYTHNSKVSKCLKCYFNYNQLHQVFIFVVVVYAGLRLLYRKRVVDSRWESGAVSGSNEFNVSPWDDKPFEILPNGKRAYLDEQDVVAFLDPPNTLIPLDPTSYNPAAYLW